MKQKYPVLAFVFAVITLLIIFLIFSNSTKVGEESAGLSLRITLWLERTFPILKTLFGDSLHHLVRKTAHFTEFAALGFSATGFLCSIGLSKLRLILDLLFLAIVPSIDETIQLFTPDRGPSIRDVLLDFSGACFGLLFLLLIWKLALRRNPK